MTYVREHDQMRVEKTVFISYRRTNVYHARAVQLWLAARGYDVFLDIENIDSGAFERIILAQIDARAHFLIILTPSALKRCIDPHDMMRREIERAIEMRRDIVPLMFDQFDFNSMCEYLVGKLELLPQYNGLNVYPDYFNEGMKRLDERFLNKPLDIILHPTPSEDIDVVKDKLNYAATLPMPTTMQLKAEEFFEKGFWFAIRGDYTNAIADYNQSLSLNPSFAEVYNNREPYFSI